MDIRNIAIIAHVDHGKTALTDAIMEQTGEFREGMSMDADALEKERGITIYAKNSSAMYRGTKINIVDTPGHADFGSEVERVLRSIDSVLLVVDAQEGPMPQTRFVLKKSLELGLKPIVVINKIDKPAANPAEAEEKVLELFLELGASDEQMDFTPVYAIARDGVAMRNLTDERKDITPLLDVILELVPPASGNPDKPFLAQPFNLAYDNFLGRLAVVRVYDGAVRAGDTVYIKDARGESRTGKVSKLFTFRGINREEASEVRAGDIAMIAGLPDIFIGETVCQNPDQGGMPAITVDEPTITLNFLVNDSPFAGREGTFLTTRQIRERLEKELEVNVGLAVDFSRADVFKVCGRGELHIAVLLENMRREGFELQVSQPHVITKEVDGQTMEPFEEVVVDVPVSAQGVVIERLGARKGVMTSMSTHDAATRLTFEIPARGLLGYRGQFVVDTRGEGILSHRFIGFHPYAGEIEKRATGSMISMANGKALGFSLANLQERGVLYIGAGTEVYEGMVVGNTAKGEEMVVNPVKGKQLTNMRASGSDEAVHLTPPQEISIESGLELIESDEYLEITPRAVRIRKQILSESERSKAKRKAQAK